MKLNRLLVALLTLSMLLMAIPALAETPAEPEYELTYLDTLDDYADQAALSAVWTAGNSGADGLAAQVELIEDAEYTESGKGIKFSYIPEQADWWSPSIRNAATVYEVTGDGITFWLKNEIPMMMRVEFLSEDYWYQCYWDLTKDDMEPGVHRYYLKFEDLVIKEAGVELEKDAINFKEDIKKIVGLTFYGYGPENHWQAGFTGCCYIDAPAFFDDKTEPQYGYQARWYPHDTPAAPGYALTYLDTLDDYADEAALSAV